MRILGVSIEEDGDIMVEVEEDTVAEDIEVAGEVLMEVLGVVTMVVVLGEDIMVIRVKKDRLEVLRKVMAVLMVEEEENGDITDIMDIRVKKDLLEVLRKVMAVLMVEEEESGEITLRNSKNKRCVLLLKSK